MLKFDFSVMTRDGQKIDSVSVTIGVVWSIPVNTTVTNAFAEVTLLQPLPD